MQGSYLAFFIKDFFEDTYLAKCLVGILPPKKRVTFSVWGGGHNTTFTVIDNSFKTFPSYSEIINYFADKDNDKINNPKIDYIHPPKKPLLKLVLKFSYPYFINILNPLIIYHLRSSFIIFSSLVDLGWGLQYYKKYVDGFKEYGKFYNVKKVYEEYEESEIIEKITKYEKLIESFEELNKKKEKYIYLNNSIGSYLKDKYFFIDYSKSYDEWRKNNPKLVVNNYEFKDLLADLELLLPVNERIKLIGRDKFNFSFYLYSISLR